MKVVILPSCSSDSSDSMLSSPSLPLKTSSVLFLPATLLDSIVLSLSLITMMSLSSSDVRCSGDEEIAGSTDGFTGSTDTSSLLDPSVNIPILIDHIIIYLTTEFNMTLNTLSD